MEKLKVLIVDDDLLYRRILSEVVENTGLASVGQTASNGSIALERMEQDQYDVVLLDVFMPQMDGLATLSLIQRLVKPPVVIMFSSLGADSAAQTIQALKIGAMDFIAKPTNNTMEKNIELLTRQLQSLFVEIKIKYQHCLPTASSPQLVVNKAVLPSPLGEKVLPFHPKVVVIAASTGGPAALEILCAALPANFNLPILIVQHMPPEFTKLLAKSMDGKCKLAVVEAVDGEIIQSGKILIAPGSGHMSVTGEGVPKIKIEYTPTVNGVRPAADVLFSEVAQVYRGLGIIAVILTGMGKDGMDGVQRLKKNCNCYCITQSEKTCTVYGMPRSVDEAGLSDESSDLEHMAARLQSIAVGRG